MTVQRRPKSRTSVKSSVLIFLIVLERDQDKTDSRGRDLSSTNDVWRDEQRRNMCFYCCLTGKSAGGQWMKVFLWWDSLIQCTWWTDSVALCVSSYWQHSCKISRLNLGPGPSMHYIGFWCYLAPFAVRCKSLFPCHFIYPRLAYKIMLQCSY